MTKATYAKHIFLIIMIFITAVIETDIYLPAFPDMMEYFQTNEELIQSLLTWNFIGLCLSGPFYGPLADSYGRKKPLIAAMILFFIGSIITIYAEDFDLMRWGRVLQGLGSGGCFTLGSAIIFDVFDEKMAMDALNKMNTIVPLIMATAPMLGGYLNYQYGFRANFVAIALCVAASLASAVFVFKESLPASKRIPLNFKGTVANFKKTLGSGPFWKLTCIISLLFTGYLGFLSTTSILFVVDMGIPKKIFPFLQGSLLVAYVFASLTCNKALEKFGVEKTKKYGLYCILFSSALLIIVTGFYPNPYALTVAMLPFTFGFMYVQTPYFSDCMNIFPDIKGIVASLITSIRLLITATLIGLASKYYNGTALPTTALVLTTAFISTWLYFSYERKR